MKKREEVSWRDIMHMQQIISMTVDLITRCANNNEGRPGPKEELSALVREDYHADFEFRVVHPEGSGKETEGYKNQAYIGYHTGVAAKVDSVERLCGAITLTAYRVEDGHEFACLRNKIWTTMFWKHDLATRKANFAHMEWTFTRRKPGGPWKLLIWDDALRFTDW